VVSFCYPLFPVLFVMVGVWMIFYGVQLKPYVSLAAAVTIATGALVYHWRWRPRGQQPPVVETYD
jgi:heme A synthase